MADKEKKKGLGVVAKLVIVVVLAVAVIHLAVRFGGIEALKSVDVVGMALSSLQ